ncbi:nuclear transport factor 2 family protein [Baekduia soli]|uniref:Nuclear transport factor 2 family protein n=1 Tax=Baekduia soli TaxID=496014 RepID=A0A5B8U0V3_9ACTN|nr:nuclear transport factor 2 family protein [Baekduia soli]QEC46570.1 nuclear transport factor 2 family protein [Baekduia soli]
MAAPRLLIALLVASAAALSACGQTTKDSAKDFQGDQKAVAQTVEDLQKAGAKRDSGRICSRILAPALVDTISKVTRSSCESGLKTALDDADTFELQVEKVTVSGSTASALVTSSGGGQERTDTLTLQKVGSAWKISSLGRRAPNP